MLRLAPSNGLPKIRVAINLMRTRYELTHYGHKENGDLEDFDNDMMDNLRYIVSSLPGEGSPIVYEPEWMMHARSEEDKISLRDRRARA